MSFFRISLLLVLFCAFWGIRGATFAQQQPDPYLPFAEQMPQPVGGLQAIYKNIKYPDAAKRDGVQGKVYAVI